MLTRREFFTRIVIGSVFLNACQTASRPASEVTVKPAESPIPAEQFTDLKLQVYGRELAAWVLKDGTKMANYTEVRKAIDILSGKIDPRIYVPFVKPQLIFIPAVDSGGAFIRHIQYDRSSKRRGLAISLPTGEKLPYYWISNQSSRGEIRLDPSVQSSSVRMPVLVKEVSQVYDLPEYYRLYMKLAQEQGISYRYINEDNVSTTQDEILANACEAISNIETEQIGSSFLNEIIDTGSHIRVGGISFANWYQDQINRGFRIDENSTVNRVGISVMQFLKNKRLIMQDGSRFVWTRGQAPNIDSKEFMDLLTELSGKSGLTFKK